MLLGWIASYPVRMSTPDEFCLVFSFFYLCNLNEIFSPKTLKKKRENNNNNNDHREMECAVVQKRFSAIWIWIELNGIFASHYPAFRLPVVADETKES